MKFIYLSPENARHAGSIPHATDIHVFATIVRTELGDGDAVHIEMEPGDATKYEFLIYPVTDKAELIVSCVMGQNWSIRVHNGSFPYDLGDFADIKANPCTLRLIADFLNLVAEKEQQGLFDFEVGRALE